MQQHKRRKRQIIAHHLILTLYGHWPPNDPRGSGSSDFYDEKSRRWGRFTTGANRSMSNLQEKNCASICTRRRN